MTTRSVQFAIAAITALPLQAGLIAKKNNSLDLNLGESWEGSVAPGPNDIAHWYFQYLSSTGNAKLTSNTSWGGIKVDFLAERRANIGGPFDSPVELSIGADGIDIQGTNTSGNKTNNGAIISTDFVCAADQVWQGVAGAAQAITILGTNRNTGSYVDLGSHTVNISAIAVSISGGLGIPYSISNGTFALNNDATLRINSGSRKMGSDPSDPITQIPSSLNITLNPGSTLIPWNKSRVEENLIWNANLTLNGGTLHASAWGIQFIGGSRGANSHNNTLGGTIDVTAPSTLYLSYEIGAPESVETLHKITANLTGSSSLSIANESSAAALNYITLAGDNSGFTGAIGLTGTEGSRTLRLTSDTAGSADAIWNIGGANTLEVENSTVDLGSLTGSGTLSAMGGGESTIKVGGGSFLGTITQDAGSTLHFRKVGGTTHTYRGTSGWNGDTFVDAGTLTLTKPSLDADTTVSIAEGAMLRLSHSQVDGVEALIIDGDLKSGGTWGAEGSGAQFTSPSITGSGLLFVTGTDPYLKWIIGFPALSDAADREPGANPDMSRLNNLGEFAFAGDPTNGSDDGGPFETALDPDFRYVLPVRQGAVFSQVGPEMVSAPVDGIIYRIQASLDLVSFDTVVLETPAFEPEANAPPLPEGWEYRSFETDLVADDTPRQFIRAAVEAAP